MAEIRFDFMQKRFELLSCGNCFDGFGLAWRLQSDSHSNLP